MKRVRNVSVKTSKTQRRCWLSLAGWAESISGNRTGSLRFARRGSGAVTSIGRPLLRRLLGCRAAVKPWLQSPNWRG